ncbi:protein argonaute 6-like [Silene latifolia]|uniref:protein argonaute 6-like n=1 Tax=Silene latifolia TaxID=37657 RepID=UPI003D78ADB6
MAEGEIPEPDQSQSSPPSALPPLEKSDVPDSPKHQIMHRPGFGSIGRGVSLLVNHSKVSIRNTDEAFYQYAVNIMSEDDALIERKSVSVKIIDRLFKIYSSELEGKLYVFDGEENLYTFGPLSQETFEFMLTHEEPFARKVGNHVESTKKSKHSTTPKLFKVKLTFCMKVPLGSVIPTTEGHKAYETQNALRVLNTILRQLAFKKGCLLVRQSYFKDDSSNIFEIGEGVLGLRGYHSSFHMTRGGLSLNLDVAMTLTLTSGPVLNFLMSNQNVKEARYIDWEKAKRVLTDLKIKTSHTNKVYKITGLTEKPCHQLSFLLRVKEENDSGEELFEESTIIDYFLKQYGIALTYSKYMPCIDVGTPSKPIYLPLELCSLVSLQRYTKSLSPAQQVALVEKTKQKPPERMKALMDAMENRDYENDPLLATCGVSVEKKFMHISGRVLEAPKLKVGKGEDCFPCDGRWTFKNKQFLKPVKIKCWAIVNFSSRCDTSYLSRELISCGMCKGMDIERPYALVEENQQMRKASPLARIDAMFEKLQDKLPDKPEFILCVLPERKICDLYGPWKMRSLCDFGLLTQCVSPIKVTDRYLTNVLLKINTKLGGINSLLTTEKPSCLPHVTDFPTMIVGMDVSHGPPGLVDRPSIAAVVGSLSWPLISRYRVSLRTQSPRTEIIDSLFKPLENGEDAGSMSELLKDFFTTSKGRKPKHIIVFRDGVSESQFSQVLNIELEQIKQAYLGCGDAKVPKFTVIVAQKRHHTRFFPLGATGNVQPGTVVDTEVVHPSNYDFYMCAHGGMIGTLRPVHYHVLLDEIGFSPNELQNFVHSLCYTYQRSSHATSIVAPIAYAHHAALQAGQFMKSEFSNGTSDPNNVISPGSMSIPKLHDNIKGSMFFC